MVLDGVKRAQREAVNRGIYRIGPPAVAEHLGGGFVSSFLGQARAGCVAPSLRAVLPDPVLVGLPGIQGVGVHLRPREQRDRTRALIAEVLEHGSRSGVVVIVYPPAAAIQLQRTP